MRYTKALKQWMLRPILTKRFTRISAFIKKELMELKDSKPFADMISRIVQARTAVFNLLLGVFIRPAEDKIYRAIDKMYIEKTNASEDERTILKGLNAIEQASMIVMKWKRIRDCCFLGIDASRFDQCCNTQLLKFLHRIICECFPRKKDRYQLEDLLRCTLVNKCIGSCPEGIVKYLINGGLCSGEMTTALTGCVIMSCCIYVFLVYWLKIPDFAVIDMGDDAGIFVSKKYLSLIMKELPDFFDKFGLKMTVEEPVYEIEHIEFCQSKPVWDGVQYRMVRNPHTASVKDSISLDVLKGRTEIGNYLNSVGQGGLALAGGIPMQQDYYLSMIEQSQKLLGNKKPKHLHLKGGLKYLSLRMSENYKTDISDMTRLSFWRAFGITPEMQMLMEDQYRKLEIDWREGAPGSCAVRTLFRLY